MTRPVLRIAFDVARCLVVLLAPACSAPPLDAVVDGATSSDLSAPSPDGGALDLALAAGDLADWRNGWVEETLPGTFANSPITSLGQALVADPVTPRRLMLLGVAIGLEPVAAIPWSDGVSYNGLIAAPGSTFESGVGAWVSDGSYRGFMLRNDADQSRATVTATLGTLGFNMTPHASWDWSSMQAPALGNWPPNSLLVDRASNAVMFTFASSGTLSKVPAMVGDPTQSWALAASTAGRTPYGHTADGSHLLLGDATSLERCAFPATTDCEGLATTGLPSGALFVGSPWLSPVDAVTLRVSATDPLAAQPVLYASSDSGATLSAIPTPIAPNGYRFAIAPAHADTIAVIVQAGVSGGGADTLQVTQDLGQTWQKRALPSTPTPDAVIAFDAAGALFLLRGGQLFSLQP